MITYCYWSHNVQIILLVCYLLADLESGSLPSREEANDGDPWAAANRGEPTRREGESQREGEEATTRLASSSHSWVNLLLVLLLLGLSSIKSSRLSLPLIFSSDKMTPVWSVPVKLYTFFSVFTVPKNMSFMKSVRSGTGGSALRRDSGAITSFLLCLEDWLLLNLKISIYLIREREREALFFWLKSIMRSLISSRNDLCLRYWSYI